MPSMTSRQRVLIHLAYACHDRAARDEDRTPAQVIDAFITSPPPVHLRLGGEGHGRWSRVDGFSMTSGEAIIFRAMVAAIEEHGPFDDDRDLLRDAGARLAADTP